MSNYLLSKKESFTVLGIGEELKSDYTDFMGINQEKVTFLDKTAKDGTIEKLKRVATNEYFFVVNEAVNNKMMYYLGVLSEETIPEATRSIQFPESEYLIIPGEGSSFEELSQTLTATAFGEVLPQVTEVAYVGGPNTTVQMGIRDGVFYGEMWIPVVRK